MVMAFQFHQSAARQWPRAVSILMGSPKVESRSAGEGRGLGLFACQPIPAYSEIINEAPLILMKPGDDLPQLYEQFINLPSSRRGEYLSLSCYAQPERDSRLQEKLSERGFDQSSINEMIKVAGIMQTNAFNVDLADGLGSNHRGLFPTVARINHSCAPNAHVCFYPTPDSDTRGHMTIHALRSIDRGEELAIAYFSMLLPRQERQQKSSKWGFSCNCQACGPPSSRRHEQQRQALEDFTSKQTVIMQDARSSLKQVNDAIKSGTALASKLADYPAQIPALPDLHDNLAMLHAKSLILHQRERERQVVVTALEQATIWEARITGATGPPAMRRLAKLAAFAATKDSIHQPFIAKKPGVEYEIGWTDT